MGNNVQFITCWQRKWNLIRRRLEQQSSWSNCLADSRVYFNAFTVCRYVGYYFRIALYPISFLFWLKIHEIYYIAPELFLN